MSNDDLVGVTTCPNCSRVWPYPSEQSATLQIVGQCYGCLMIDIIKLRDARGAQLDYTSSNCPSCVGSLLSISQATQSCVDCSGRGWVILRDGEQVPDEKFTELEK